MTLEQATEIAASAVRERVAADGRTKFSLQDYEHLARMTEGLLEMPAPAAHKLCPDCAGRGVWPRYVEPCASCGGEGKI